MRRKEQEITDNLEIEAIIQKAKVCRLGLAQNNIPYVIPVFFGYKANALYIHCAKQGRKADMIRQNNRVCFQMDVDTKIRNRDKPACQWSSSYRSVIGYGTAVFLESFAEKKQALDIIMKHYSPKVNPDYSSEAVENVGIIKITVTSLSGKRSEG
jgi:nitroimidazol reductase NimA-like FMN-containing flavoprotein (pyridoxamine 5'-phosphate oxidase superfamily)